MSAPENEAPAPKAEVRKLEERLGHVFRDPALLREALTHPSTRLGARTGQPDNERLEFLGDAVLQLAVTERLYDLLPEAPEGKLTQTRATLVSRNQMAKLAEEIGLGALLEMSFGEERNQGRTRSSNLAHAMEAVIGAVFRDGGWEAARAAVARLLDPAVATNIAAAADANAKGDLQELLQRTGGTPPRYLCLREEGPAHDRFYEVAVERDGKELGRGTGKNKQEAEFHAARAALAALRGNGGESTAGLPPGDS